MVSRCKEKRAVEMEQVQGTKGSGDDEQVQGKNQSGDAEQVQEENHSGDAEQVQENEEAEVEILKDRQLQDGVSYLVVMNGVRKWYPHSFLLLTSPSLLLQYNEKKRILRNISMDQKVCGKDHEKVEDFVEDSNTWYLRENQEFHDVRCIKCRREILAKKGPNGFVMGYRKPIYVCSGRAEGCKAVYCGDCWGEAVVCLKRSRRRV